MQQSKQGSLYSRARSMMNSKQSSSIQPPSFISPDITIDSSPRVGGLSKLPKNDSPSLLTQPTNDEAQTQSNAVTVVHPPILAQQPPTARDSPQIISQDVHSKQQRQVANHHVDGDKGMKDSSNTLSVTSSTGSNRTLDHPVELCAFNFSSQLPIVNHNPHRGSNQPKSNPVTSYRSIIDEVCACPPYEPPSLSIGGVYRLKSVSDVFTLNSQLDSFAPETSTCLQELRENASTTQSPEPTLQPLTARLQQRLRDASRFGPSKLDSFAEPLLIRALMAAPFMLSALYKRYEQLIRHKVIQRIPSTSSRVFPALLSYGQSSTSAMSDFSPDLSVTDVDSAATSGSSASSLLRRQLHSKSKSSYTASSSSSLSSSSNRRKSLLGALPLISQLLLFATGFALSLRHQLLKAIRSILNRPSIPLLKRASGSSSATSKTPSKGAPPGSTRKGGGDRRRTVSGTLPTSSSAPSENSDIALRQHGFLPLIHAGSHFKYHILVPSDQHLPTFQPSETSHADPSPHGYVKPAGSALRLIQKDRYDVTTGEVLQQPHQQHVVSGGSRVGVLGALTSPSLPSLYTSTDRHALTSVVTSSSSSSSSSTSSISSLSISAKHRVLSSSKSQSQLPRQTHPYTLPPQSTMKRRYLQINQSSSGDILDQDMLPPSTTANTKRRRTIMGGRLQTSSAADANSTAAADEQHPVYSFAPAQPRQQSIPVVELLGKRFTVKYPRTNTTLLVQFQNNHAQIIGDKAHLAILHQISAHPTTQQDP